MDASAARSCKRSDTMFQRSLPDQNIVFYLRQFISLYPTLLIVSRLEAHSHEWYGKVDQSECRIVGNSWEFSFNSIFSNTTHIIAIVAYLISFCHDLRQFFSKYIYFIHSTCVDVFQGKATSHNINNEQ